MLAPLVQSEVPAPEVAERLAAEEGLAPEGIAPDVPEEWVGADPDEEVEKSERLLEEYASAQQEWAARALANDEFRNGLQWRQADWAVLREQNRPTPVINVIAPAVEQAKSMLTSNRPRFDVAPRGDEDRKDALVRSVYLSHVWDQSKGNVHFDRVVDDYYVRNRGCWFAFWDPAADGGRGGVRIRALDPLTVYPDPNSRDPHFEDAAHVHVAQPMTRAQIEDLWPWFVEELDLAGKARIDYAKPYAGSRAPNTGAAGQAAYGGPFVGDNGQRAAGAGAPGQDDLGNPQIGDISAFGSSAGTGTMGGGDDEHQRYEVVSRFTKTRVEYHTIYDPATGEEVRLDAEEYERFREAWAFVIASEQGEEVFITGDGLDFAEGLHASLGGQEGEPVIFHLMHGPPEVDAATGQLVPGAPVPVPGPEPAFGTNLDDVIEGSTRVVAPVPKGVYVDDGTLEHATYREERWMEVCSVGGVRCYDHLWPVSRCPVVPVPNRHNRNPYPSGDLDDVRPLQRQLNYTESKILHHLANSLGDLIFTPRGSGVDKEELEAKANMPGRHFIEYDADLDGNAAIHTVSPSPLPGEMFHRKAEIKAEIREILGLYEFQQGAASQAPQTYRGTLQLDEFGQRRIRKKAADHEYALGILGGVVLELAAAYETERKVLRLTQPHPAQPGAEQSAAGEVVVNEIVTDEFGNATGRLNDLGVGAFDVRVVTGSTLYDNKLAEEQVHLEYFQAGIIDDVEVLKQVGRYDADGVLRRKGMLQQSQQMIQMLQEEVQRLSGDMQTKDRELETADRRVADQKYQKRLAMHEARAKTAVDVADKRLGDIVKQAEQEANTTNDDE